MACTKYTFNITNGDLGNAVNNTSPFIDGAVYIDFTDCNSNPTTVNYYAVGSYDICLEDTTTPVMYYYNNNVYTPVSTSSFTPTLVPCSPNYVQCCYPNGPIYESVSNTPEPVGEGVWFDGDYCYSATTNGPAYFTVDDTGFWLFVPDGCSDPQCPECCSCVEVNLSNLDLTQGGQDLWLDGNQCGSQVSNSQIWSAYPYVMTPSGPTVYMCLQKPAQLKYKYGIVGTVIFGVPPNSNFTVGGTCTTANDCNTPPPPSPTQTQTSTPTPTATQTQTPTQTPTPTITPTITPTNTVTPTQTKTPTPTPSTTPIICGSGTTTGTYYYTDCCGNFVQGTTVGLIVSIDYTKPYNGVVKLNVPATTVCASPTPTPTPTITPTNTVTPTVTPTSTVTPTPTNTPKVTPSNSPYVKLKNDCDVVTLFDMGIQCYPLAIPTSATSSDGVLAIQVTGGTAPYSYYWAGGQRTQTLVGVPKGAYEVTVVDYYGDYTATTVCGLFEPSPTPTSTVTPTPAPPPAPVYPDLCLIYVSPTISYGPIQFVINGTYNGKPTWTATYNQTNLDVEWSIQNSRWEIQGWTFTVGIPVSVNTSNVPDSGWSMAGGQQAQLSMTQGDCPAYLPLQSVPISQNTTCPAVNNGSITLVTSYGVPQYQYSINNGQTYQQSNVFQGLSPSTYTVITKDSANNTLSNTVVITSLGQNANYTIGVVVDSVVNLSPGSQLANWRVNVTPPLPFGTTISFVMSVNNIRNYYSPGFGTISGTTVVKKNNVNVGIAGQSSTPLVTSSRAFCSPENSGTTTTTQTYNMTIGNGDIISGSSISDLLITNGQVSANSCVTKLEQSILINTVSATITGGECNSVANNPQPQGITNHSISNTNSTPRFSLFIRSVNLTNCSTNSGGISRVGYPEFFTITNQNEGTIVSGPSATDSLNCIPTPNSCFHIGETLSFNFLSESPSCGTLPCSTLLFNLKRNGVDVVTDDITSCVTSNNSITYTYTVPAGTTLLSVQLDSTVS
jgi:hypothetical protein